MAVDLWHFKRMQLAEQVLMMFESGMSNALVFFAPRRMGKTEFLLKDIIPIAEKRKWMVFYYSFLDAQDNIELRFNRALRDFIENTNKKSATKKALRNVKKIGGELPGGIKANIEFKDLKNTQQDLQKISVDLVKKRKVLLLFDEVQVLANDAKNKNFLASLRTLLDVNKDFLKVIFTGSSREGLRQMFSDSTAPFFHFGQNLSFPVLDKDFTDYLACAYHKVTHKMLDKELLWEFFVEFEYVPQLIRSLVERLALNPELTLLKAKEQLLEDLYSDRAYAEIWEKSTILEQLILYQIAKNVSSLFSKEMRMAYAKQLGIESVAISSVQSVIRGLLKKQIIGKSSARGHYFIDDPNFNNWLLRELE